MNQETLILLNRAIENISTLREIIKNNCTYNVHYIYPYESWQENTNEIQKFDPRFEAGELVFAGDDAGNFFTISDQGKISFFDHETEIRTFLYENIKDFLFELKEPTQQDVAIKDEDILEVWVDPEFQKSIGLKYSTKTKPETPKH